MSNKIMVKLENIYGNKYIYPVCERAQTFTALTGRKTLSPKHITLIKSLGFDVEIESPRLI